MKRFLSAFALLFIPSLGWSPIGSRLNIATQDGTTCNTYPYKAIFPNANCTDNGDGTVSINVTGGGGGGNTIAANQFSVPYYSVGGSSTALSGFPGITLSTNTGVTIATNTYLGGNAYAVQHTSNTILPGTTFYQSGLAIINGVNSASWLTGNQSITLTGPVSGSGTTSIATTSSGTLTGDVTGTGNFPIATTLAASGVSASVYGSATIIPVITVDVKGRVTSVSSATMSGPALASTQTWTGTNTFSNAIVVNATATITSLTEGTTDYGTYGSSGTITPNAALGNTVSIVLGSTVTINGPTNPVDGMKITFRITQGVVGSKTVTWATGAGNFAFGSDIASITLTTTASAVDYVGAIYSSSKNCWHIVSYIRGF